MTPVSHRQKLLWGALAAVCVTLIVFTSIYLYRSWQREQGKVDAVTELQELLAEIDRTEPGGWDLAALEQARAIVPDDRNAADLARKAWELLPAGWEENPDLPQVVPGGILSVVSINSSVALKQGDADQITTQMNKVRPAVIEAQKLLGFSTGRFSSLPIKPGHLLEGPPAHVKKLWTLKKLLTYDALAKTHRKETDSAWLAALAIIHVGRAVGDEVGLHAELLRITTPEDAVFLFQRILGQGSVSDALLERAMAAYSEELEDAGEIRWLRGERARQHHFYTNLANGQFDPKTVDPDFQWPAGYDEPERRLIMIQQSHAYTLRLLTKVLDAMQKDAQKALRSIDDLRLEHQHGLGVRSVPALAQFLTPAFWKVVHRTRKTKISCLLAALSAERFRLKKGRWPKTADELVDAGFLKATPFDHDLEKPLEFRETKDGMVFYSPGHRGYEGNALDELNPTGVLPVPLVEFRVWSPEHRRRTPPEEKPE